MCRLVNMFGLFLPFICILVSIHQTIADPVAHVFLIAGQSNSEGFNSDGHTDEDVSYPNIWQLDCCFNGSSLPVEQCQFSTAQDPLHHQCDFGFINGITIGYGMSFARAYRQDIPAEDVIILVPSGVGGTGFFDNTWTAYTGWGFNAAANKLKQTFKQLGDKFPQYTARFEGIVWQQGTHDAGDNVWGSIANTTLYLSEIIPMINAWRDPDFLPFTYSELPFLCANIMPAWAANPAHPLRVGVFMAIALLDQYVPYTACSPSFGLVGDPGYPAGADSELVHFTASSQRILGKRYHAALYLAKANAPEPAA